MLLAAPIPILPTFLILIHHSPLTYSTPTHLKLYKVSQFSDQFPPCEAQAEFITRSVLECSVLACSGLESDCRLAYNFTSMSCTVNPRKHTRCRGNLKSGDNGNDLYFATSEKPPSNCGVSYPNNRGVSYPNYCDVRYSSNYRVSYSNHFGVRYVINQLWGELFQHW